MKYKNSFFKIRIKEDGTYLDVFPPKEDGKRLDIREVVSFLEQKGFAGFSIDALRKTLDLLQEKPLQIKISDTCAKAFDESATIITGKDNMIAYIRFYPPSTGGIRTGENSVRDIGTGHGEAEDDAYLLYEYPDREGHGTDAGERYGD